MRFPCPGTNPFSAAEMDELAGFTRVGNIEPILVLAAGGDPAEAGDIAAAFKEIGATRLLATKLDMTRRLGGILVAADSARLKLCEFSATAQVADGLSPINPVSLARILLPDLGKIARTPSGTKAHT
jgi:flagellar biosynthesis protein FlhF